jgi:hypothetical protein
MGMQTLAASTQAEACTSTIGRHQHNIDVLTACAPVLLPLHFVLARVAWDAPVYSRIDPWPFHPFPLTIAGPVITHPPRAETERDVTVPQQDLPLGVQQHLQQSAREANRARPLGRNA